MNALEIYAVVAPAVALVLMGAFGFLLLRRDVAYGKLFAASNAAAAPTTGGGRSVAESAPTQGEKVVTAAGATVDPVGVVGTFGVTPEATFAAEVMVDQSGPNPRFAPAAPPPPLAKPRRNLLFSSSSRKEGERALAPAVPSVTPDPVPAAAFTVPVPGAMPPGGFEDVWPESAHALRRTRTPSTFAEPNAAPAPAPPPEHAAPDPARSEEPAPVTVLKSGVVDGMAYSLYSDGSIEAQMPEGMMRFASIDELRSHLDQRP